MICSLLQRGDLIQIPANAPFYRVDCESSGQSYSVLAKENGQPLLAIYLYFNKNDNMATVWMDNQEWRVGAKHIRWNKVGVAC